MSTITMNLPIEVEVAKRIRKYASHRKTSVSSIAENFFAFITATPTVKAKETDISPLVKSFSIDNVNIPADFDYKTELTGARNEKYL
ncbi:MAG: DUF6364 family protein [Bacteroidetes bacterium]|nr:DUF6364 family protein [Bacteroidota bacterium]